MKTILINILLEFDLRGFKRKEKGCTKNIPYRFRVAVWDGCPIIEIVEDLTDCYCYFEVVVNN